MNIHVYSCTYMHLHVHTCIYMSTLVFGVNKRPQHVFLETIDDLNTHFWQFTEGGHFTKVPYWARARFIPHGPGLDHGAGLGRGRFQKAAGFY